jgi:hypothetical protein
MKLRVRVEQAQGNRDFVRSSDNAMASILMRANFASDKNVQVESNICAKYGMSSGRMKVWHCCGRRRVNLLVN